ATGGGERLYGPPGTGGIRVEGVIEDVETTTCGNRCSEAVLGAGQVSKSGCDVFGLHSHRKTDSDRDRQILRIDILRHRADSNFIHDDFTVDDPDPTTV